MTAEPARLHDLLALSRERGGPAFVDEAGAPVTAAAFDARVAGTADWLSAQGLRAGDCLAVWLDNGLDWPALLFAAARLGLRVAAVNTRYKAFELEHIIARSHASLIVLGAGEGRSDHLAILAEADPARIPELTAIAVRGPLPETPPLPGRRLAAFDPVPSVAAPAPDQTSDPDVPLIFFTTSGTTSAPKLVTHSQRTLALHAHRCASAFGFDAPGAGFLAAMPFCGVFGLSSFLAAVAGAAPAHMMAQFDAAHAARIIRAHGLSHIFGSDEMFRRLIELDEPALAASACCGFGAFTPGLGEILRAAADRGVPLRGVYGASELHALFGIQPMSQPVAERIKGGGAPASRERAEIRVRDPETGALLPPGETGELEFRCDTSFLGYFENPEATARAVDAEGFYRSGDIGHLRGDGTFVYAARGGDAIRLSGFLVDPAEIEEALRGVAGVGDAQVVGLEIGGRLRPVAFVIPDPAATGAFDEAKALAEAGARLAHFKTPARLFPIDAFPVTQSANGVKIRKSELRDMARARLEALAET
ncbi:fatty-acyl-CoA synthase [Albimonas donghaensis]|uniref:Long-chain-fatty-acid--CoA ligase n=1 Tax=Albimonas donghaensis TaxID=356660 RepID=A0A1H2TSY9_9RHOB|nr:AMP-binding protein [Albimonas donghaensis]SDW46409.1 fatty-acyl-CoA synthase [Albimonas donghaensis]